MPEPVGGKAAFGNYLSKTLTYPKLARKEKIQGRVFVEFIVEKDGSLTNARIVKGIGGGCDEEALKAINASSPWIPGKHEGTLTRVRMIIPITFTL
ncbi:protein TonB [Catalinimonas alkaloidigena]|uniref:Protein TonB n=2 Tax=Catalinimonas alkaloidigena TaxID=1075417 RepID=A0A1G9EPC2_9BACT|nr:protein TonB [Catalinimonas alkaloidigena]